MRFFDLLPSDLHICILITWIKGGQSDRSHDPLLKTLSALGISCCSAKYRQPWLELAASMRFRGTVWLKSYTECYWLWLSSRKVPVPCLTVCEQTTFTSDLHAGSRAAFTLPAILELIVHTVLDPHALEQLLSCCPNLTSIFNTAANSHFWRVLEAHPALTLTEIAGTLPEFAQAALVTHGHHLIKLDLELTIVTVRAKWDSADILAMLPSACPLLESLSLMDCHVFMPSLLSALKACSRLTNLMLEPFTLSGVSTISEMAIAATSILETCHLKRFVINMDTIGSKEMQHRCFAQLLAARSELEYLCFQGCSYSRTLGHLMNVALPHHNLVDNPAEDIVAVCAHEHLIKLTSQLVAVSSQMLSKILARCPALEILDISCFMVPVELCAVAVRCCKQLQSLIIGSGVTPSEEDILSVLAGLPCLKELKVWYRKHITFRVLQAIVDDKRCLHRFCCGWEGFQSAEVAKFRLLAKEAGMLPVPWIGPY